MIKADLKLAKLRFSDFYFSISENVNTAKKSSPKRVQILEQILGNFVENFVKSAKFVQFQLGLNCYEMKINHFMKIFINFTKRGCFSQINIASKLSVMFSLWGIPLSSVCIGGTLSKSLTKPYICLYLSSFSRMVFSDLRKNDYLRYVA